MLALSESSLIADSKLVPGRDQAGRYGRYRKYAGIKQRAQKLPLRDENLLKHLGMMSKMHGGSNAGKTMEMKKKMEMKM